MILLSSNISGANVIAPRRTTGVTGRLNVGICAVNINSGDNETPFETHSPFKHAIIVSNCIRFSRTRLQGVTSRANNGCCTIHSGSNFSGIVRRVGNLRGAGIRHSVCRGCGRGFTIPLINKTLLITTTIVIGLVLLHEAV